MKAILPKAALDQHGAVLGKTGSGKSSVLRLLVEGLLDGGLPVCIIDPKGDWWGLKSSANGKSAGYPVIIFGGEHADISINPRTGSQVAELVATGNRPCIIDLGGWGVAERTQFFIAFASALFKHARGARYLVIDECHNFAPQGKTYGDDTPKMLHWANRLASEGRGKGITLLSASQRPQKVHKDYLTCHETLIAMRVIHPLDRNAIKDWIDGCPDAEKGKEVLSSLASMPRGEGWVWSPEIGFGPVRVKFPLFSTYDSFKPQGNTGEKQLKGWATVNLDEVKAKLENVVKEAEANDPARLKTEIAKLKAELNKCQASVDKQSSPAELRAASQAGFKEAMDVYGPAVAGMRQMVSDSLANLAVVLHEALDIVRRDKKDVDKIALPALPHPLRPGPKSSQSAPKPPNPPHQRSQLPSSMPPTLSAILSPIPRSNGHSEPSSMPKVNRTFLTVLAQQGRPLTRNQVAIFAGYSAKSRHVDNTLSALRMAGYVAGGHRKEGGDGIEITPAGIAALGHYTPLPTGEALREYWTSELDKAASTFLGVICNHYPGSLTREQIAAAAGYSPTSRHVDNTLAVLRTRDLISGGREAIKANPELFS